RMCMAAFALADTPCAPRPIERQRPKPAINPITRAIHFVFQLNFRTRFIVSHLAPRMILCGNLHVARSITVVPYKWNGIWADPIGKIYCRLIYLQFSYAQQAILSRPGGAYTGLNPVVLATRRKDRDRDARR